MNRRKAMGLLGVLAALAIGTSSMAAEGDGKTEPKRDLPKPDGKPADMRKPVKVFILAGQSNMVGMGDIHRRYELRSTMMTSNRPLEDWGKLIGDVPTATAILDRFLHHAGKDEGTFDMRTKRRQE